jgi:hypothetical protein
MRPSAAAAIRDEVGARSIRKSAQDKAGQTEKSRFSVDLS